MKKPKVPYKNSSNKRMLHSGLTPSDSRYQKLRDNKTNLEQSRKPNNIQDKNKKKEEKRK